MLKIAPLIDIFFADRPWPERAAAIAACGYRFIETWRGGDVGELKQMNGNGVQLVSVVMNFATQAEVAPVNPASRQAFLERIDRYADNALSAGCRQGIVTSGQQVGGMSYQEQRKSLVEAMHQAGSLVRNRGFQLNIEPLNTEVDHAGYMLSSAADAVAIAREAGCDNVKVLYDIYHMAIMGGNLTAFLRANIGSIGHFHVAGVPGRHEPENGETNYPFLLREIAAAGYQGHIGLEYFPLLPAAESLRATARYFKLTPS